MSVQNIYKNEFLRKMAYSCKEVIMYCHDHHLDRGVHGIHDYPEFLHGQYTTVAHDFKLVKNSLEDCNILDCSVESLTGKRECNFVFISCTQCYMKILYKILTQPVEYM